MYARLCEWMQTMLTVNLPGCNVVFEGCRVGRSMLCGCLRFVSHSNFVAGATEHTGIGTW